MKTAFNNKITSTLQTFNKYELNRFRKFVDSPFFNENKILLTLLDIYSNNLKKNGEILHTKEKLWQLTFGSKTYNDTKFRRLNSDLLKLAEEFLVYIAFQENPSEHQNLLIREVNRRSIDKLYNSTMKQAKVLQKNNGKRDARFYYDAYLLEVEQAAIQDKSFQRTDKINLDAIHNNLDYFYLSEKLKQFCSLLNYKEVVSIDFEPLLIEEVLDHLRHHMYEHIPAIEMYHKILLCMRNEGEETYYHQFCSYLNDHTERFSVDESRTMYGFAQNYCIKKINTGHPHYLQELFKLYQTVLDKEIILNHGVLSPWDYKNIVTVGIRIEEFDWIENFLNQYKEALPENYRENAYTYNLAKLYFNKEDFTQVIRLLLAVEYQDVFYQLDSKTLLLKTYYELEEDEPLYALIDSFKVLLNRKKIVSSAYRTNYMNLLKHTKKLIDVRNGNPKKLAVLKADIEADGNVADLNWLQKKMEELG